ncbi:MAG: DUF805 domain-containing protein [Cypionkella sp.]
MGLAQAIRTGFAKSFQYSGRASRSEYWWFLSVGVSLPLAALGMMEVFLPTSPVALRGGVGFLMLSPLMGVTKRRLSDSGEDAMWFETPLSALVFFLLALWGAVSLSNWAFASWTEGADGPDGFAVLIAWLLGNCILIPVVLHQFFVGLITGCALFSQMAAPSRQAVKNPGPNPFEVPK